MADVQLGEAERVHESGISAPVHSPRGLQWTYWRDCVNHCPGCGRTCWYVGRFSAECCHCRTALALEHSSMLGVGTFRNVGHN